jgi:uncharacterized protein YuzE
VTIGQGEIASTAHISDDVMVDVEADGTVHGIEFLCTPAELTEEERAALVGRLPVAAEALAATERLTPDQRCLEFAPSSTPGASPTLPPSASRPAPAERSSLPDSCWKPWSELDLNAGSQTCRFRKSGKLRPSPG